MANIMPNFTQASKGLQKFGDGVRVAESSGERILFVDAFGKRLNEYFIG